MTALVGQGRRGGFDSRPSGRRLEAAGRILTAVLGIAAPALVAAAVAHEGHSPAGGRGSAEDAFDRSEDYDYDVPAPGSYRLPPLGTAPDGAVLDSTGRPLSLHEAMAGRIVVLSFIYTRCADPRGCPLATGLLYDLSDAGRDDPEIAGNLRLISLSFDPGYDTPDVMAAYGGADADGADWMFLTTRGEADLAPILAAYGQPVAGKADAADPFGPLYHQLRLYLIDRAGRIRNIYSLGFLDPRLVLADIRTLLLEERAETQ